jgi:hypothetical protein
MKRVMAPLAIATCMLLPSAGTAFSGQPGTNAGVNCGTPGATSTPGNSASANGAPFNPTGTAGGNYANAFNGSPPSTNPNAKSPLTATSQYDVACKNVTAHQPP